MVLELRFLRYDLSKYINEDNEITSTTLRYTDGTASDYNIKHKYLITEALESGTVHLVGTDYNRIFNEVSLLIDDPTMYEKMSKAVNPYGDGHASERIVSILRGAEIG